jgi:hypothetical protein
MPPAEAQQQFLRIDHGPKKRRAILRNRFPREIFKVQKKKKLWVVVVAPAAKTT